MRAEIIHADNGLPVACIEVDRNLQIVSSIQGGGTAPSEGGWNARGGAAVPEPVRQSPIPVAQLRLQRPARAESRLDDWDPVARERLRDRIRLTNSGDTLLLLDDDDLDHALLMVVDGPYVRNHRLPECWPSARWMRSDVPCPWHRKCFK